MVSRKPDVARSIQSSSDATSCGRRRSWRRRMRPDRALPPASIGDRGLASIGFYRPPLGASEWGSVGACGPAGQLACGPGAAAPGASASDTRAHRATPASSRQSSERGSSPTRAPGAWPISFFSFFCFSFCHFI
jgi:hypothetical protein